MRILGPVEDLFIRRMHGYPSWGWHLRDGGLPLDPEKPVRSLCGREAMLDDEEATTHFYKVGALNAATDKCGNCEKIAGD